MGFVQSVSVWKIAQIRLCVCVYHFLYILYYNFLPCMPTSISAFPKCSPFSLWRYWGIIRSVLTGIPHWDGALQRAQSIAFVSTGWEMSLCRSLSLLWPQSLRIEMLMWHYESEVRTVQPFVDRRPFGVIEMCAYSRANAISGCSHSRHSEIAHALVGLLFMSSFERQLDILIMSCKCICLYNASDYSDSQDKPYIS